MSLSLALALSQSMIPAASLPPSTTDPCAAPNLAESARSTKMRSFTLEDQLTLNDIGRESSTPAPPAFGISPDGKKVAVRVNRANPQTNAYCLKLVVASLDGTSEAKEATHGGEFIRDDFSLRNFSAIYAGWEKPNIPRWSPDGTR